MLIQKFFETEKILYLYILFQAIKDYIKGDPLTQSDAFQWINSDSNEFNSFNCICDILGCDPSTVRKNIIKREKNGIIFKLLKSLERERDLSIKNILRKRRTKCSQKQPDEV